MNVPTTEDLANLIRVSSSPMMALAYIVSAYPEERRASLTLELHSLCSDILLMDSMFLYEKHKKEAATME